LKFSNILIDFSDLILQLAQNATLLAPPLPPSDNIIATTGQVEQVADQSQNAIIAGLTTAGAAIAGVFVKNQQDNKKSKQQIRDTDQDLCEYIDLVNRVWEYSVRFPDKKLSEIMVLPAYQDQPLSKITLGEALSKESMEWKEFIKAKYYTNP
jgi:hypothetical protein